MESRSFFEIRSVDDQVVGLGSGPVALSLVGLGIGEIVFGLEPVEVGRSGSRPLFGGSKGKDCDEAWDEEDSDLVDASHVSDHESID